MILNDALYFINAGKGITFKEIVIVSDDEDKLVFSGQELNFVIQEEPDDSKHYIAKEIRELKLDDGNEDLIERFIEVMYMLEYYIANVDVLSVDVNNSKMQVTIYQ